MYAHTLTVLVELQRLFNKFSKSAEKREELTNQSVPCRFMHIQQMTPSRPTLLCSPEEILAALVNSPFSMQVIRVLLSSTVLRRAAGDRPLPLLDTMTVLKETRGKLDKESVF